jgi:DNA-binding winged helix-turn-helix (wHTH) protein/tetratricopeptide (TPR) repeat protein/TolB-like protein
MSAGKTRAKKHLYEFGDFRLDPAERVFARKGERIPLAPKAFDTLLILVQHHGHVLTKDELIKALWPDTIVEENNLTQQISQLRHALGEGVDASDYIETVPKLGYRFLSEVREIVDDEDDIVVSKRTRTRIVLREEEEIEEDGDSLGATVPAAPNPNQHVGIKAQVIPTLQAHRSALGLSHNWKWISVSFGFVVLVVAGAVSFRDMRSHRSSNDERAVTPVPSIAAIKPRYSIAVLGFKNLSGRPEDAWLSAALAEMLTTELTSGGQLRVVSGEEVHRIKSDLKLEDEQSLAKPTLAQIRNRVGADIIVSGSYVEVGREPESQIRLDLRLQDAAAGETVFATAVSGRTAELFSLVSRSGAELRSKLGAPRLSESEGVQDQAALPSTPEAARFYSQGLSRLRMSDAPASEKLLARAVAADPDFALGHSALASAWSALGYDEKAKSEARRALDLSLNLSRQQHLLIAGQYSELSRDWEQAVATYQQLFSLFPDSVDYGIRLARAQTSAGKGSDALATLEKLRRLASPTGQDPQIDLAQATAAESLGDFKQELEDSERAIQKGETLGERLLVARAQTEKSWAMRRMGRTDEAISTLLEARRIFSEAGDIQGVGYALRLVGGAQQERGEFTQAERSYQEAIAIFRRIGDRRALAMSINGLAIAHYENGDLRGAKALDEQYLEIEREVGSKTNTAGALGNIANVEDALGNLAEARRLNEESLKIFAEVGDQRAMGTALGNLAILHYEQGDLEGARKKFEEALEIKRTIGYQRGIAYDLSGLSEILRAEGNLDAARKKQEEALAIRDQLGEKHNAAESRLYLAILDLEERRPAEAEKIATASAQQFHEDKSAADEAAANEVEARSLLAQGKITESQAAIDRARALTQGNLNLPLSFEISATSARIRVAGKNPTNHFTSTSARKGLESSLSVARRCGYLEYEYKLGMALGEVELQSDEDHDGRTRLEAIAAEAHERGFGLIARSALALLKAIPIPR